MARGKLAIVDKQVASSDDNAITLGIGDSAERRRRSNEHFAARIKKRINFVRKTFQTRIRQKGDVVEHHKVQLHGSRNKRFGNYPSIQITQKAWA